MKFQETTITLQDVSGVVISQVNGRYYTWFNFTANGRREYAVRLKGAVDVKPGTTVTAILRKADNWQTLEGWFNHQRGRMEGVTHIGILRVAASVCVALFLASVVFGGWLWATGRATPQSAMGLVIAVGLVVLVPLNDGYRGAKVWAQLRAARVEGESCIDNASP